MASPITVPYFNTSNLVPGTYFGVTNARANNATIDLTSVIIGQMLASGTATVNIPVASSNSSDDADKFGAGSMLYAMIQRYRAADPNATLYVLPVADNGAGTAAVYTVTFANNATSTGTLPLYVAGQPVFVAVTSGNTPTQIATAVAAAVNAIQSLPCTATSSAGVVTLTAKHKGIAAGDVDVRLSYGNEPGITGTTMVVATGTAGAGDPDLTSALGNMSDLQADGICNPYTSNGSQITSVSSFLSDATGRWNPTAMLFGHQFTAIDATLGAAGTFANTVNDQHLTCYAIRNCTLPMYLVAAEAMGRAMVSLKEDPGLPVQNLITTIPAPAIADQWTFAERQSLLTQGLSTFKWVSGTTYIERTTTTYTQNTQGFADNSYRDIETMFSLVDIIRYFLSYLSSTYGRKKLIDDGNNISYGQNVTTPKLVLNDMIGKYASLCAVGRAQNPEQFAQQAQIYNDGNGDLFVYAPFTLNNQLREIVGLAAFTKG